MALGFAEIIQAFLLYCKVFYKTRGNCWGETQPGSSSFWMLHVRSLREGAAAVDVIYGTREERRESSGSGLELFVLLSSRINFLGTDDDILFWRIFFFSCVLFSFV